MKKIFQFPKLKQYSSVKDFILRYLHLTEDTPDQRNAFNMIVEIFFATFLNAAATFNAAFAIRLGSNDEQVSFLSSIPALIAIIISIPAGKILQKSAKKKKLVMGSLAIHRAGYLLIALVPWLKFLDVPQGTLVVILLILFTVPAQFFNVGWTSMTGTVIKEDQRAAIFSLRNQIYFTITSICAFLFGLWLDAVIFPLNYQIMFIATFGVSIISIIYLMKIEVPENPRQIKKEKKSRSFKESIKNTTQALKENPQFMRLSINTFVMDIGLWAIAPFFTIFYVRDLGASDSYLGLLTAFSSVANIIGFGIWRKFIQRYGRKKVLTITSFMRPIYPIVVALIPDLTVIIIVSAVTGLLMPGLSLSHYSLLLTTTPDDRREEFTAYYTTIQNISAFVSPFIGAALIAWLGYAATFLIFAGVRVIGALMWRFFPIEDFDRMAAASARQ